jgi:hypothetical protein
VEVKRATDTIILNGKDVQVQHAEFVGTGGTTLTCGIFLQDEGTVAATVSYEDEKERILFKFPSAIPVGNGKLKMTFTGTLNDKLKGYSHLPPPV